MKMKKTFIVREDVFIIVSANCALAATIGSAKTRPVVRGSFPAPPRRGSAPSRAEPHNRARTHAPADGPSRSFTHVDRPFVVRDLTLVPAKRGETRAHAPAAAAAAVRL